MLNKILHFPRIAARRVHKYIVDCRSAFTPLPEEYLKEFDKNYNQNAEKERNLNELKYCDPRYNYYAPMCPPYNDIINMNAADFKKFRYAYVYGEYKNSWYALLSPSAYAEHHARVIQDYVKQLPEEEQDEEPNENWARLNSFREYLTMSVNVAAQPERLAEGKVALENGFVQFIKGYSEGKKSEEEKGPLKLQNMSS